MLLPPVLRVAEWLVPLLLAAWIIVSSFGRVLVLRRFDAQLHARPITLMLLQVARMAALLGGFALWFACLQAAATVAVMPEAEDVDIEVRPEDIRIDVFRAGGKGGQGVNRTDSAVRLTYVPTGMVVTCQDERSQLKNKAKALRVLRARLFDQRKMDHDSKISRERKAQIGSGDRSEKIRTYNFPDRRITDHRIGFTAHNLEVVLEGELDEMISALKAEDKKIRLASK